MAESLLTDDEWGSCRGTLVPWDRGGRMDLVSTAADGNTIVGAWSTTEPGVVFYNAVTPSDEENANHE